MGVLSSVPNGPRESSCQLWRVWGDGRGAGAQHQPSLVAPPPPVMLCSPYRIFLLSLSLGVSSLPARHPAAHSGCSTSIICHLLNLRGRLSHLGGRAAGSGESWVCNLIQTFPSGHVNWLLHACSFVDKPGFYENTAALSRTLWDAGNRNPHLSWRVHPPRKSLILRNRKSKGGLCS